MNVRLFPETLYLKNRTTNFDETLHVAQACPKEHFSTIGMSRYPLVWLLGPPECHSTKCPFVRIMSLCPNLCMCPPVPLSESVHMSPCPFVRICACVPHPFVRIICPDLCPMSGFVFTIKMSGFVFTK